MAKCENCYHKKVCINSACYKNGKECRQYRDESLIVELPCRVGDTVWYYDHSFVIENITIYADRVVYRCGNSGTEEYMAFDNNDVGKTVFLTREDAEKALEVKETDFYINQKPVSITFECPHCENEVGIAWDDLDVPKYWVDDWGEVECPICGKTVLLGDYDMD